MRQVLEVFDLLSNRDSSVQWRLIRASTNSPFYAEGEAVSFEPGVDVTVVARTQKQSVADGLRQIDNGEVPDWDEVRLRAARRLYERNLNGVGKTDIDFQQAGTVTVTPRFAAKAMTVLSKAPGLDLYQFPRIAGEVGSIEGTFAHLGTFRNRPAIGVIDTRTKTIVWCILSPELQAKFADKADFEDFWKHSRVIVRGHLRYGANRALRDVWADDIVRIEPRVVPLSAIHDHDFTGGITSVSEYLDRFRDGTLGG